MQCHQIALDHRYLMLIKCLTVRKMRGGDHMASDLDVSYNHYFIFLSTNEHDTKFNSYCYLYYFLENKYLYYNNLRTTLISLVLSRSL